MLIDHYGGCILIKQTKHHRAFCRFAFDEFVSKITSLSRPEFDFKPVIDEWARVAMKELDFQNEAGD
jgi:hypothetical protein